MKTLWIAMVVLAVSSVVAMGIELGANITIMDGVGTGTSWYSADKEDSEVEPNCITGQKWDVEGFFLDGYTLTIVGGYDFVNGEDGWQSGDIFLDVTGDALFGDPISGSGSANTVKLNTFGWDYVLDMDFSARTYDVYSLTADSRVTTVWYAQNDEANPWRYYDRGTPLSGYQDLSFTYWSGLSDADVAGLAGGVASHNAAAVSLDFLSPGTLFTSHFTQQCGNDNVIGRARIPDGGSTIACLGLALLGVDFIRRRIRS